MTEPGPDWWHAALADFGAGLGFADATAWTADVLNLAVEDGKYLIDVERTGETIILAVLRRAPAAEVEAKARLLLRATGFEHDHPFFLQAGLKGADVLVLAARVERAQSRGLFDALGLILGIYADMGL